MLIYAYNIYLTLKTVSCLRNRLGTNRERLSAQHYAVSYTHLDVYKRQDQMRLLFSVQDVKISIHGRWLININKTDSHVQKRVSNIFFNNCCEKKLTNTITVVLTPTCNALNERALRDIFQSASVQTDKNN